MLSAVKNIFSFYQGSNFTQTVGSCQLERSGTETRIISPSTTLLVNQVTADVQVHDHTKLGSNSLGFNVVTEDDGTKILICKADDGSLSSVHISDATGKIGYSVDIMPDPLRFLPFMSPTFTKELLYDDHHGNTTIARDISYNSPATRHHSST